MKCIEITIKNETGLHTRPGNELVKFVKSLEGTTVEIEKGDKKIRAASLLQIMSLGVKKGDTIKIHIDGKDEDGAAKKFEEFFASLKD